MLTHSRGNSPHTGKKKEHFPLTAPDLDKAKEEKDFGVAD
jgi:hypothetical protein